MPSQRPSAAFDPISPNLNLAALVEETPNFEYVTRVSCDMIEAQSMEAFEKLILLHVILGGKPLVIEGFQHRLDEWTFASQWLKDNCGQKFEQARNLMKQQNISLSIAHYLNNMSKLTNQWNSANYRDPDRQRIYLKDIDCPPIWHKKLEEQIPPSIFYLNESTGEIGGPGSTDEVTATGIKHGRGVARAGDLMSCLPPPMRAENMMCYIGHEGTYTPAHREMCASLGQNLMVETSRTVDDEGKPAKPGSSIWFMTETKDRHLVSEYWLSTLGHDIEVEKHFAQINAWKAAPFAVYVVEQKVGDFILIPPLAPHQVWNRGTRTMKVAWNRTTVETLEMALHEALPRARMVCRDEQYKNKAIVYFALQKYSDLLKRVDLQKQVERNSDVQNYLMYGAKIRQLQKDFRRLFALFTEILLSESLSPVLPNEKRGQYLPYDSFVTCSYCRCNIFNRFLTCETCVAPLANGEEDTYDICMDCFTMGRSCGCISKFRWVEQFPWQDLVQKHELWRHQIIGFDGVTSGKSPSSLQSARKSLRKKTLAQVCQEQLKIRPWNDPDNPTPSLSSRERNQGLMDDDEEEGGESTPGSARKKKTKALDKHTVKEHVSCHRREPWKCAICSKCSKAFDYGSLWRMFDMIPITVMENPEWECPVCLKICSCGACRKKPDFTPYEPNGTVLGHDTKKVADRRSVESLVGFGTSNLHFIKKAGDDHPVETRRLGRRIDEAARAKASDPTLDENYIDDDEMPQENQQFYANGIRYTTGPDIPIDPMLGEYQPNAQANGSDSSYNPDNNHARHLSRDSDWGNENRNGAQNAEGIYGSGVTLRAPTGVAPVANMVHNGEEEPISNSNEHLDPTTPGSPVSNFGEFQGLITELGQFNRSHPKQNESNEQFRKANLHRILEEARRNGRYISAEAALRKKHKWVVLRIPQSRLGGELPTNSSAPTPANGSTSADKEIVKSDLPTVPHHSEAPIVAARKRKMRAEEIDGDFSTRKRRDRKSQSAKVATNEKGQTSGIPKYTEVEDSSDSDAPLLKEDGILPVSKPQGPRPLPKYLAERTGDDEDFPTELTEEPRRRPPKVIKRASLRQVIREESVDAAPRQVPSPIMPLHSKTSRGRPPKSSSSTASPAKLPLQVSGKKRGRPRKSLPVNLTNFTAVNLTPTSSSTLDFPLETPQETRPSASSKAVQQMAEENRRAKMKAVQWAGRESDFSDSTTSSSSVEEIERAPVAPKPNKTLLKIPTSMFSRPGMAGKKIKIAGVKPIGANGVGSKQNR